MSYLEPEAPPRPDDSNRGGTAAPLTGESRPVEVDSDPTLERSRPDAANRSLDHADQGITGRVLRPDGAPARGLLALLTGNQNIDALADEPDEPVAPLAQTVTDEDGA